MNSRAMPLLVALALGAPDFADIGVPGAMLRMPVGGVYAMRASRKNPAKRTQGTLMFTYSGFEEVPPR